MTDHHSTIAVRAREEPTKSWSHRLDAFADWTATRSFGWRIAGVLGGTLYFALGFAAVAAITRSLEVHTLRTRWDDAIPFLPWTIYLYTWVYTSAFYPVFVIRSPRLYWRMVAAYVVLVTVSLGCFLLFPVTSVGLRPPVAALDDQTFTGWGVRLTYFIDPPVNLFPSLHMGFAALAVLASRAASRTLGACAVPIAACIAVSICTTKQHFLADGAAAIGLAAAIWWFMARGLRVDPQESRSYGARGVLWYPVFQGFFYAAFYVAFRTGLRPWAS
jgi:hypothetical protein